jgi:hypothetical protein
VRGIQFGGIRDKFFSLPAQSSALHQRYARGLWLVPLFAITGIAFVKFVRVSFGVYLKHQALVDGYHQYKLNQKYQDGDAAKTPEELKKKEIQNKLFSESLNLINTAET